MSLKILFIILFFFPFIGFSQEETFDKVIKMDNSIIEGKVIRVTDINLEIDPKGDIPFLIIPRNEINILIYSNNTVVNFNSEKRSFDKDEFTVNEKRGVHSNKIIRENYTSNIEVPSNKYDKDKIKNCKFYDEDGNLITSLVFASNYELKDSKRENRKTANFDNINIKKYNNEIGRTAVYIKNSIIDEFVLLSVELNYSYSKGSLNSKYRIEVTDLTLIINDKEGNNIYSKNFSGLNSSIEAQYTYEPPGIATRNYFKYDDIKKRPKINLGYWTPSSSAGFKIMPSIKFHPIKTKIEYRELMNCEVGLKIDYM